MFRLSISCIVANLLFTSLAIAQNAPTADELKQTEATIAKVFEAAGVPAGKNAPWVVVELGSSGWKNELHGWLVGDDIESITVLHAHGALSVVRRPRVGEKKPKADVSHPVNFGGPQAASAQVAWTIQTVDYETVCESYIRQGHPTADFIATNPMAFASLEIRLIEGCIYSYWATRLGKNELSQRLSAEASKARKVLAERFRDDAGKPLDQSVLDKLTQKMRNSAQSDANQGMPRTDLVKLWEIIAKLPDKDAAAQAKMLVAGYKSLIQEDRTWKEPKILALLTEQQKIDYWLYKLRDLDDTMYGDMAAVSMGRRTPRHILNGFLIPPPAPPKPNPALELKKIGEAALPAVIAHLDDTRPTRCGSLLRYGDCCQQIFEGITAHKIFDDHGNENYPVQAGEEKLCKDRAENWWAEHRAKKGKPLLISAVEEGTLESWAQVDQLLQKYPNDAFEAIVKGVRQSSDPNVRVGLIKAACKVKDKELQKFLQEELHGPFLRSRITAAEGMIERGNKNGSLALIKEWQESKWGKSWLEQEPGAAGNLIEALLRSGDLTAVEDVARAFPKQPIWIRSLIIEKCESFEGLKDYRGQPLNRAIRNVIEEMLARALDDMEVATSSRGGGPGGKEVVYPTIADLAAEGLALFWGQHLLAVGWQQSMMFNLYDRPGVRELQRLHVKNAWLKKRGKPLLPVPTPRKITPTDPAILEPLLVRAVAAKSRESRNGEIAGLERLGLPALPALTKAIAKLPPEHPARPDLESAASRLALTIAQIRFSADSAVPPADLQKHLAAFEGKPIGSDELTELFQFMTSYPPPDIRGIHLKLERPGDNCGACLTITLVPEKAAPRGAAAQLDVMRLILLDDKRIAGGGSEGISGFEGEKAPLTQADWKDFAAELRRVYPRRPEQYLFVQMGCCREYQ